MDPNLPYINVFSDEHPKRNLCYATFACSVAKIAQTAQNKHTAGNDTIIDGDNVNLVNLLLLGLLLDTICVWNDCYIFAYFSQPIVDLELDYIFG